MARLLEPTEHHQREQGADVQGIRGGIKARINDRGLAELYSQFPLVGGLMDQTSPVELFKNRLHVLELDFVFLGHGTSHICDRLF